MSRLQIQICPDPDKWLESESGSDNKFVHKVTNGINNSDPDPTIQFYAHS